jgi:hypothetical protein
VENYPHSRRTIHTVREQMHDKCRVTVHQRIGKVLAFPKPARGILETAQLLRALERYLAGLAVTISKTEGPFEGGGSKSTCEGRASVHAQVSA